MYKAALNLLKQLNSGQSLLSAEPALQETIPCRQKLQHYGRPMAIATMPTMQIYELEEALHLRDHLSNSTQLLETKRPRQHGTCHNNVTFKSKN